MLKPIRLNITAHLFLSKEKKSKALKTLEKKAENI